VDTRDIQLLRQTVGDLAEDVASRLRHRTLVCETLQLKYRFEGFETHTRQQPLRPASNHGPELFKAGWKELRAVLNADARRLRLVGLSAMGLKESAKAEQEELFGQSRDKLRRLDEAVDAIRGRHGDEILKRGNQSPEQKAQHEYRKTGFSPG
ncbi:MAG: hypothetical protein ACREKE_09685, partial [bacterium]